MKYVSVPEKAKQQKQILEGSWKIRCIKPYYKDILETVPRGWNNQKVVSYCLRISLKCKVFGQKHFRAILFLK